MKSISIYNSYTKDNEQKREQLIEKMKQRGFYTSKKGEYLIVIGGDGTFLSAVRKRFKTNPIFVGINAGSLGFFAEYTMDTVNQLLTSIQHGDYWLEEISVFEAKMVGEETTTEYFINDFVIERRDSGVTAMSIHADDKLLMTAPADHLVFSTKMGSTGHNLSAGGPISFSDDVFQAVFSNPIYNKQYDERVYPCIFSNNQTVTVFPSVKKKRPFRAIRDGQLVKGTDFDYVEIKKTPFVVRILRSSQFDRADKIRSSFIKLEK